MPVIELLEHRQLLSAVVSAVKKVPALFTVTQVAAAGVLSNAIATADFNGDGKADVAVATNSGFAILKGNGKGGFTKPAAVDLQDFAPQSIVAADFNGDRKIDLAVVMNNSVHIALGNGRGSFTPAATLAAGNQISVVAADFNHDGKQDLVVGAALFLGKGDGTFQAGHNLAPTLLRCKCVVADFNHDGRSDLAVMAQSSNEFTFLMNQGGGNFSQGPVFSTGSMRPVDLAVADFNGDKKQDVVLVDATNTAQVRLGNGKGGFGKATVLASSGDITSVFAGDINGDNAPDVVITNVGDTTTVDYLLGNGKGAFGKKQSITAPTRVVHVVLTPLIHKGKPAMIIAGFDSILLFTR